MLEEQLTTSAIRSSETSSTVMKVLYGDSMQPKVSKLPNKVSQNSIWVDCLTKVAKSQDKAAFAKLFEHFAPRVKSFLMKSGATEGMAEECVQETMVTVWHKSKMFDPTRANASTWIFTIARNKRIDAVRKRSRPEPDELSWNVEHEPDAADVLALEQENKLLSVAISELPEKQRDLVKRAFYGDLTHKEIADETGLPLGTIKSRLRLALEKLRHEIKRV